MLSAKLQTDKFDAFVRNMLGIRAEDLLRVGGVGVANYVRDWFFELDRTRNNKLGGKKTHFFADIARSVQRQPTISGTTARININHVGLAQRWLGGTIRAGVGTSSSSGGPTKYLAIPIRAESYGKTPGEFHDLHFVPTKHGGMLVQNLQTGLVRGKKGFKSRGEVGGLALFWLATEVNQKADPTVMPEEQQLASMLNLSLADYLSIKMQGRG